jgi:hypothetical protein
MGSIAQYEDAAGRGRRPAPEDVQVEFGDDELRLTVWWSPPLGGARRGASKTWSLR